MKDPLKEEVEVIEEKPVEPKASRGLPKPPPVMPVAEAPVPRSPRPKPKPRAKPPNLTLSPDGAKYVRVQYILDLAHTIEDTFDPEYWSQVAEKFIKPISGGGDYSGSIIEVRYPDNSMYAELFIRAVQERALHVALMNVYWFGSKATVSRQYEDRWNPGLKLFEVIRKSDGEQVFKSRLREKCKEWIENTK